LKLWQRQATTWLVVKLWQRQATTWLVALPLLPSASLI